MQNITRSLRPAYTNYQESVARFPFDKLTADTRRSFESVTESVDSWLERGVLTAEVQALNFIWTAHPNTGIRGPKTPSEEHLETSLRIAIDNMQFVIGVSDDECLAPFVPSMVPSFQPFTDAVVAAAIDQIPNINDQRFKMSLQSEAESLEATTKFVDIINACGSTASTETCIKNFLVAYVDCSGCRFTDPFTGPFYFVAMDAAGISNDYSTAMQSAGNILMLNQVQQDIQVCRRD